MNADGEEDIDGLDDQSGYRDKINYPLDDVMVRSETRTVGEIMKRINNGRYAMNPDFQRDFVWSKEKQSKLIESCIMRIPLPVLYVAEGADGRVTVVDGLQRLSTFRAYINNNLSLVGLGKDHPLNDKLFSQLPVNLQERIEDTQLTLYILDKNAPENAKLDIFERVNSGVALTRQQMRNALYNGKGTQWIAARSAKKAFLNATGGSLSSKTMRDREAINRYCAFSLMGPANYKSGDMDEFLAESLKIMNNMSDERLLEMQVDFVASMKHNRLLFGKHAFRKSLVSLNDEASRSVINIALFDVLSVLISKISEESLGNCADEIRYAVANLIKDDEFNNYITYATNSTYQVHGRFRLAHRALGGYLS